MGTVYLAEQREPVRRRVALKVLKHGLDDAAFLARFAVEKQALALMEHSNIARIFEAGTDDGRPWLAMEFVKGVPITEYCDEARLSIGDRLALFRQVCAGVQHAHTKGIMHRDLKPSNILVTQEESARRIPKVIDFGLAKASDHRLLQETLFTEVGQVLGTPEYMSPEQAGVTTLDVDTRTDVYALGVLLYQLLTGALPVSRDELLEHGWLEMLRLIRESEPPKPSTRITTLGASAATFAKFRSVPQQELRRRLRGDLDWIVMKAIAKDRARRYMTVEQLAEDLLRHERHEPVSAGPPTPWYLMRKTVRRYRVQFFAAGICVLALAAGLAVAWSQRNEAVRQRGVADAALNQYRQVRDLVRLRQFRRQADELPAIHGDSVEAYSNWDAAVTRWLQNMDDHGATLAALRDRGTERDGKWVFDDLADQFLFDTLSDLLRGIDEFNGPGGLRETTRQRLRWAERLQRETIEEHRDAWRDVARRVRAHADFEGLELPPQQGLVPLGENEAGLEEFWFLMSGERPPLEGRRYVTHDVSAIVLVLVPVPGGVTTIGSPEHDPLGERNPRNEQPRTQVEIEPFFIGKYELTQGQWMRLSGWPSPSKYPPRAVDLRYGPGIGWQSHPVENVQYDEACQVLASYGLLFPTEAQWEHACRAGTTTEWHFGDRGPDGERDALIGPNGRGLFNVADGYDNPTRRAGGQFVRAARLTGAFDDGWVTHTYVGNFSSPNAYGLYDIHGNIAEMTRGTFVGYDHPDARWAPGDGELRGGDDTRYYVRGGSWWLELNRSRSAIRSAVARDARFDNIGVRVARPIDRD